MTGPILSDKGTQAIDGLISSLVRDGHVPALYLGATSKDGELYWGRGGNRMWGQPAEGLVSDDTSQSSPHLLYASSSLPRACRAS